MAKEIGYGRLLPGVNYCKFCWIFRRHAGVLDYIYGCWWICQTCERWNER